jgi:formiminotetrahydrofolate cyclodeaminase
VTAERSGSPGLSDSLQRWGAAVASPEAAPAGGAAAAIGAALAAGAVELVAGLTGARERYAAVHERAAAARARGTALREELLALAVQDAEAFAAFRRALALPRGSDAERAAREEARGLALREGARVQLELLRRAAETADLAAALAAEGLATALGDAATAGFLSAAAASSAYWAARSNLEDNQVSEARRWLEAGLGLLENAEAAEWRIRQLVNERIR